MTSFNSGVSDMKDKPCSEWTCTAVIPLNEECLDQLICANLWIMTRELCTEMSISFNALETMMAILEYLQVCSKWVSQMLTQEEKELHI